MEKDENIPFFINLYDPIAIFVFDNEIFGCESIQIKNNPNIVWRSYEFRHGHMWSEPSFLFLVQLYQHDFCRKSFPEKLHKHFEKIDVKKLPKHYKHFTEALRYSSKSFDLFCTLAIDPTNSTDKPITIKDFSFDGLLLNQTISLHPKEAFYIFANICTNVFCNSILPLDKITLEQALNKTIKQDNMLSYNEIISSFAIDYLKYLDENFASCNLDPEFILRMSGTRILMALSCNESVSKFISKIISKITTNNLTKNYKILYTILLLLFTRQPNPIESFRDFYDVNALLLEELITEIKKPFPKPTNPQKGLDIQDDKDDIYLPLFWFQGQPIEIYVLKNRLLGAQTNAGSFDWGSAARPFQLLYELNKKTEIGNKLPSELKKYLDTIDFETIKASSSLYKYLLGWDDPYANVPYLDLNLQTHLTKKDTVVFYEIFYLDQKLDIKIEVTTFEAFILLANIYISKFLMNLEILIRQEGPNWNLERLKEIGLVDNWGELSSEENAIKLADNDVRKNNPGYPWTPKKETFSYVYLKYIYELLVSEKITAFEILQLSGAPTLVILTPFVPVFQNFVKQILLVLKENEKISFNRKIIYFTLLEMIMDKLPKTNSTRRLVKDFYDEHYSIIHSISNLLEKTFPTSERAIID